MAVPSIMNLSDIGLKGLVVFTDDAYSYSLEETWREYRIELPSEELQDLARSGALVARAPTSGAVFVNLSEIVFPRDDDPSLFEPGEDRGNLGIEHGAEVILFEKDKFFAVPSKALIPLEEGAEGDAGVLVNRGTVLAAIPRNDIPSGTWCVLINLPSIAKRQLAPRSSLGGTIKIHDVIAPAP